MTYVGSQPEQPLRRALLQDARRAAAPAPPPPLARILISEDDPAIRALYAALLAEHGFETIGAPAGDGWATLELAARVRPQLLITDVNKPGLDGRALRATLRASPATATLPILTVSSLDPWGDARGPLDDYLVKPFLSEALVYRVAALLPLDRAAHDRLAELALRLPCYDEAHPVTGLPCMHVLARGLGAATAAPGWAALGVSLAGFPGMVRALGRPQAEGLLARLGAIVGRAAGRELLVGHTGLDGELGVVGPAARVAIVGEAVTGAFAAVRRRAEQVAPYLPPPRLLLRRAGDGAGLGLGLNALRAGLRG